MALPYNLRFVQNLINFVPQNSEWKFITSLLKPSEILDPLNGYLIFLIMKDLFKIC